MLIPFLIISLALFFTGAAIGSFLNVVIYRSLNDESWVTGRSRCDSCRKKISWYDNIPVLSYLILRAKCRFCKKPIALTHPVVEVLVGSLFVWWYWSASIFFTLTQRPFEVLQPAFWLVVGIILIAILVTDYLYYIIPDSFVILLLGLTIIYRAALVGFGIMQTNDLIMAIFGMILSVLFIGSLWFFTRGKGMGLGDVKLMVPLSLLLGWPNTLVGLFLSFILGGFVGGGLLLSKRKKMGQVVPFGPFLILGTFISLIWGDQILTWYLSFL
ncbi:MAG: prepilin peptidase [Candidatus Pacebacteria bacterium]|nr:prepilin peptidase [Candidatus Paceibacterota bacterium]